MKEIRYASLAIMASCAPAHAQNCQPTVDMYSVLTETYQEQRIFIGLVENAALEIWGNPETGTWTALITSPAGISCSPASGVGWESIPFVKDDPA